MTQKSLANWVKLIVLGIGIFGVIVFGIVTPMWASTDMFTTSFFSCYYWHWIGFLGVATIPCYIVLVYVWKIANQIALNNSFSIENSYYLRNISIIVAGNTAFFFIVNVIYLALGISSLSILIVSMIFVLIGISITLCAALISHLVYKAAKLQEQSDLTI